MSTVSTEVQNFFDARRDLILTATPRLGQMLAHGYAQAELATLNAAEMRFTEHAAPHNGEPTSMLQTIGLLVLHGSETYERDFGLDDQPHWDKRTAPEVLSEIMCNYSGYAVDLLGHSTTSAAYVHLIRQRGAGDESLPQLQPAVSTFALLQEMHFAEHHPFFGFLRQQPAYRTR